MARAGIRPHLLGGMPMGEAKDAVPALLELAKSKTESPQTRAAALRTMEAVGSDAGAAAPDILKTMTDPATLVREAAVQAIGLVGADAKEAVPALIEALSDGKGKVSYAAAASLGGFGEDGRRPCPP